MAILEERVKSPYSYYLDLLGSWPTGLAMASQWFIYFNFDTLKKNGLFKTFQSNLNDFESENKWRLNPLVATSLVDGRLQHNFESLIGCVFARQVKLPQEQISISRGDLTYGGYQGPSVALNRTGYENLSVTMLETNASFLDLIIRPWVIMVGYNGLVARPKTSFKYVKADYADVVMLAKAGQYNPMTIRKIIRFYNVAPISVGGETYSYETEGLKFSDVSFAYDRYCVSDKSTGYFFNNS